MITELKKELHFLCSKTIYAPSFDSINETEWGAIIDIFLTDYKRYYQGDWDVKNIKYYPGLLATLFYRISRLLFLQDKHLDAQEFSSCGTFLTSMEIYFSANIGKGLKINHGIGTVIGARSEIGNNVLLHHNVTLGDRLGGRPKIGDNVIIYPGVVIIGDISVGSGAIIGANSVVLSDVPNNITIKGIYNKKNVQINSH